MLCRKRVRRGVVSGPYCTSKIVEKDCRCGHLPDLIGLQVEPTFRGRDQQTQYRCSQRAYQTRRHFHDFLESEWTCFSSNKGRRATPAKAPANINTNTRREIAKACKVRAETPLVREPCYCESAASLELPTGPLICKIGVIRLLQHSLKITDTLLLFGGTPGRRCQR
jgi:hypothetical protein